MSWPQSPPRALVTNWTVQDGFSEYVMRSFSIGLGNKMIVGAGSIFRIF